MNNCILIPLIGMFFSFLFTSCEKFTLEESADTFFHVKVPETELPVWVKGNTASKKFVIFINGGPGLTSLDLVKIDPFNWSQNLESEIAMVYYDQRGTGNAQGDISLENITLKNYLNDLDAIIKVIDDKYDAPDIYLMGHSFGGLIGQSYFLGENTGKSLIKGWINIDGSTIVNTDMEWTYRHAFLVDIANEKIAAGEDVEKWKGALAWANINPNIITRIQKDQWRMFIGFPGGGILPDEFFKVTEGDVYRLLFSFSYNLFPTYLSSNLKEVNAAMIEDVRGTNLLPELHRITVPSLLIWGKYDDIIPPQLGMAAFDAYGTPASDKRFVLMEKSGHQPFANEPELFRQEVVDFVK